MSDTPARGFGWLDLPAEDGARRLLGCELEREIDGRLLRVRVVETEAYDQDDEASHAFRGRTARTDPMFSSAGHLYVYLSRGLHHCMNVVTGPDGYGSGALIRAAEPLDGADVMRERRGRDGVALTNGPGKLCQALGITRELSGHDLSAPPVRLVRRPALPDAAVVAGRRIGISKAVAAVRRFHVRGSAHVSR